MLTLLPGTIPRGLGLGFIPGLPVVAPHLPVAPPFVHVTRAYLPILTLPLPWKTPSATVETLEFLFLLINGDLSVTYWFSAVVGMCPQGL